MTKAEIEGTSLLTHEFPLPRYDAHFVLLEFTSLPAGYDGFDVKLNTPATEAILFDIPATATRTCPPGAPGRKVWRTTGSRGIPIF